MYNWSVDEERFKKQDPEGHKLWRLTQLINYGLDGEKLDRGEVERAWPEIIDRLDPEERRLLDFLLWNKVSSLPSRRSFWEK